MPSKARIATPVVLLTLFAALSLGGCSPTPESPRDSDDDNSSPEELPCIVGTWNLDVPDYETQTAALVNGLGFPIVDYSMTGSGTIQFTRDGLVSTDIDLTTSGTIVVAETRAPFSTPSRYSASGDWNRGDDDSTINLANWSNVADPGTTTDPAAPSIPAIDYTDIPTVAMECGEETLVLRGPDAPVSARWTR